MSRRSRTSRSVHQRIGNTAKERGLDRTDAFLMYAMDRLLYRLGRSSQAKEFVLKGGVLVGNLVDEPFRTTRDIDALRRHGPPDPDDLRTRFQEVVAVEVDDGVAFGRVRARRAERATDDYDGVRVDIEAAVDGHELDLRIDVGFGDAVDPPAERLRLTPFFDDDPPALVLAYGPSVVIAEKAETLLSKFPAIAHRLKDVLDIVTLAERLDFDGAELAASFAATFQRRNTRPDPDVLDEMRSELSGRRWQRDWATMTKEKAVAGAPSMESALDRLDRFIRPVLEALRGDARPNRWPAGGPWREGE